MSRYADIRGLALPNTPPAELASIHAATGLIPRPACVSAGQGKTGKRMSRVPPGQTGAHETEEPVIVKAPVSVHVASCQLNRFRRSPNGHAKAALFAPETVAVKPRKHSLTQRLSDRQSLRKDDVGVNYRGACSWNLNARFSH